jgi:hypothetical protein
LRYRAGDRDSAAVVTGPLLPESDHDGLPDDHPASLCSMEELIIQRL